MIDVKALAAKDPFLGLITDESWIGWTFDLDYEKATVLTNDHWKQRVHGIPHNGFLLASAFTPKGSQPVPQEDRVIVLLRVLGSASLPFTQDAQQTKIDHLQRQPEMSLRDFDDITRNQLQYGGLECRVLGAFYKEGSTLQLGSDLENYETARPLYAFRPRGKSLETIVNYLDPILLQRSIEEGEGMGIPADRVRNLVFPIGSVRFTSTQRGQTLDPPVPVRIPGMDFLARRTGVFGMTRSGKSNTVKHIISMVKRMADENHVRIGQLVYDLRGEYANPNTQDRGSVASLYPDDVVCYRLIQSSKPGFQLLLTNFYEQFEDAMAYFKDLVPGKPGATAADVEAFLQSEFAEPPADDYSARAVWGLHVALYRTLLYKAGFKAPSNLRVAFESNQAVRDAVARKLGPEHPLSGRPTDKKSGGLTLADASAWFAAADAANRESTLRTSSKNEWLDSTARSMLHMLVQTNASGTHIVGIDVLRSVREYHSPERHQDSADEIYDLLCNGRIVILDLSVGPIPVRDRLSTKIATRLFGRSQDLFIEGKLPPRIQVYVEEAHNLVPKAGDLTAIWPTLAKEGAKFGIGFVMSTQEPSSIHPNILANTENWIVTHLNNDAEIRTLSGFYDFGDFAASLKRATDVGFARVRTLSSKFVVPVQISKFEGGQQGDMFAPEVVDPQG